MRRNTFFAFAVIAMMATANTYAQRNEGRGGRREGGREMTMNRGGEHRMGNRNEHRNMNMNRGGESRMGNRTEGRDMNANRGGREFNMRDNSFHGNRDANRNEGRDMRGNGFRHDNRNDRGFRHDGPAMHNNRHDDRGYAHHNVGRHNVPDHRFNGRFDHRGHVIGWEGRVRHEHGRWGYYRDNRWYWYNRYFDPVYYYDNPVHYFNDYYYLTDGCYVPGYEGRVCYNGGRWGYYRDNDWYWYDRYYEPDYYYAHPVAHFHHNYIGHNVERVVAGVAGTIALGALISALAH